MLRSSHQKLIGLSLMVWLWPLLGSAASFFWTPDQINVAPGQEFEVSLFLDSATSSINALDGKIKYDSAYLTLKEVHDADSVINFWLDRPITKSNGEVTFSGIIPGGFSGALSPYYLGGRPGKLFNLIFSTKISGRTNLIWSSFHTFANDGFGSVVEVKATNLPIEIKSGLTNNAPTTATETDHYLPEPFSITLAHDPHLFDGQYFVVFDTRDTVSGLDRYLLAEHSSPEPGSASWQVATSPYLLHNQKLSGYVSVRALDRAGNERTVTLALSSSTPNILTSYVSRIIWLIIILCGALFFFLWLKRKHDQP